MQWVPKDIFLWIKRPVCEADHSPPSSAEVENAWSYTSTPPYVSVTWYLVYILRLVTWFLLITMTTLTFILVTEVNVSPTFLIRGCIQKFRDWSPGARIANGKLTATRYSYMAIL